MSMTDKARLAIDIGGTFTDIAIEAGEQILTTKTLTTPAHPVDGVLEGIAHALEKFGLDATDFGSVIHGTTLATNALIERRGARVGVIVTEGFRDILEIGYERRYDQYDINIEKQDLLVPRERVYTLRERIGADGETLVELDEQSLRRAADALLADEIDSIAVCLLHSYGNPDHENRVRKALTERCPGIPVSLSSEVSPEVREFDRLCTTVCNAYIMPLMSGYLRRLDTALADRGFDCPLFVVTSGGGITTLETAMRFPIRLVESGPSGGAILAARIAAEQNLDHVLSFDMGGTTAKVCLIEEHAPRSSRVFEIDRADRYLKGSGIPARIPVIEMIEIGAGGGSIAGVDTLGRLRVGPQSASSDPGPACYARGGELPTVTDSDLAAGYITPDGFAEGRLTLDTALSLRAIEARVGKPMGKTVQAAADGILQTVDEAMANAARMHAVEQGKNLAECSMVAFGGNGPLHATRVAEKVGIERIVVPPNPSVGSAVGFLFAPVAYEIVRSRHCLVEAFPYAEINALLAAVENEAREIVSRGAPGEELRLRRIAFMRYAGQGHEIEVEIPPGEIDADALAALQARFETEYARLFSRVVPEMVLEVMNWSVTVASPGRRPPSSLAAVESRTASPCATRRLAIGQQGAGIDCDVYWREDLSPGDRLGGPALIVEPQTTTFVAATFDARIDALGNILLERRVEAAEAVSAAMPPGAVAPDEIELQVMWDRLLAIVEEQAQVLIRTAFSPIVRECGDISAGIFDTDYRMLAQAVTGTPGHINSMAAAVGQIMPRFRADDMQPGDVYMTNDPWLGCGHLNDIVMVAPIFRAEQLVGYTACISHVYDLGGLGMGPDGSDVYDEGLYLPPMKLVDRGQVNPLVLDIMKANSRSPIANEGDFYALIACCDVAARRLAEMMTEFGLDDLAALAGHIIDTSRRATEAAIATLEPGTYHNELITDGYDFDIVLRASMTVSKDSILTDFGGSSGHSKRGINVPIHYAEAYAVFGMRCLIGSDIPNNAGSLEPFRFSAPEDCILNAQYPAPVAMRHTAGQMLSDLMLGCIHAARPGIAPAEGASCLWDLPLRNVAGAEREAGRRALFATELCHSGGTGARAARDGLSATAFPSGLWGTPVEIAETTAPLRIRRRELIPDSGGAGRYRGGLGQLIELESSLGQPLLLFAGVERVRYPARGRDGGGNGAVGRITLRSGPTLKCKGEQVIPAGDLLYWETPGGGGYGDPLRRELDAIDLDLRRGLVSREAAMETYGVVIGGDGQVDHAASRRRRVELTAGASA